MINSSRFFPIYRPCTNFAHAERRENSAKFHFAVSGYSRANSKRTERTMSPNSGRSLTTNKATEAKLDRIIEPEKTLLTRWHFLQFSNNYANFNETKVPTTIERSARIPSGLNYTCAVAVAVRRRTEYDIQGYYKVAQHFEIILRGNCWADWRKIWILDLSGPRKFILK